MVGWPERCAAARKLRRPKAIGRKRPALDVARQVQRHAATVRIALGQVHVPVLAVLVADVGAPVGGGQVFRVATRRIDQQITHLVDSEAANARVQGLMDAVANVGLRDTNPEAFSDLIGKLTANSGFAQVYIDASDLTEEYVEFNKGDVTDPTTLGG